MAAKAEALAKPASDSARALSQLFADTYLLYMKTYNFHWNVDGPELRRLHRVFEEQYRALWIAVGELAERIGSTGQRSAVAYAQRKMHAAAKEAAESPQYDAVLHELIADHEMLASGISAALDAARAAGEQSTVSLLTDRLAYHEQQISMMKRTLAESGRASRAIRSLRRYGLRLRIDHRHA